MFSKSKLLVAILLILTVVQSAGIDFAPKAVAGQVGRVTPAGHDGVVVPDDNNPFFASKNNNGDVGHIDADPNPPPSGINPPNAPDEITYRFKLTKSLSHNDRIILGFDSDDRNGQNNQQYDISHATIKSSTHPWMDGSWNTNQEHIYIHNDECSESWWGGGEGMYGGGDSRCIKITVQDNRDFIPANTPIEITVTVKNPPVTGWYPVGIRIYYINFDTDSFRRDGGADDRIEIGDAGDRPEDTIECTLFNNWNLCITAATGWLIEKFADFLGFILSNFIKLLLDLATYLLSAMRWLNESFVKEMIDNPGSQAAGIGFNIMLGLTNIGFIISIIVIAFATMFRRENYGLKSLPRLIIIAVVINFSMFIAVGIIGVSNQIAGGLQHVVSQQDPNSQECGGAKDAWDCTFTKFFKLQDGQDAGIKSSGDPIGRAAGKLVTVLAAFIVGLIAFITLIATAIMLLIRYFFLTFLIILLPIVLLTKIFPNLKTPDGGNHWSKWQASFTKWVLFYPVVILFISIAVSIADYIAKNGLENLSLFQIIVNWGVVCGIMIGGLIVADKFGLAGADYANNMGLWATRRIVGGVGGAGLRGAGNIGRVGRATRNLVGGDKKQEGAPAGAAKLQLDGDTKGVPQRRLTSGVGGPGGINTQPKLTSGAAGANTSKPIIDMKQDASGRWKMSGTSPSAGPTANPQTNTPRGGAAAVQGSATMGGMPRQEQQTTPGQEPKTPEAEKPKRDTFEAIWKDTETSKKIEKFKKKRREARAAREKEGIGRIESLGRKASAWGRSGRTLKEIAGNELKKHRGPFGGLIDKGHGFEKEEKERRIIKKMDEIKKAYPDRYTDKDPAKQAILDKQVRIWATQLISEEDTAKAVKKAVEPTLGGESGLGGTVKREFQIGGDQGGGGDHGGDRHK